MPPRPLVNASVLELTPVTLINSSSICIKSFVVIPVAFVTSTPLVSELLRASARVVVKGLVLAPPKAPAPQPLPKA